MRALLIVIAGLIATPVAAEPAVRTRSPAPVATAPAAPTTTCHLERRGLERRRVCTATADIVVRTEAPRPKVLIVHDGARAIVGRPGREDRLVGLPRHLN